jgi:hypothetical protein
VATGEPGLSAIPIRWLSTVAIGKSVLEEPPPTGLPKGAILTHANLSATPSQYLETTRGDPPILETRTSRSPCAPMRWRRKMLPSKTCN